MKLFSFLILLAPLFCLGQKAELLFSKQGAGPKIELIQKIPGTENFVSGDQKGNIIIWDGNSLEQLKKLKLVEDRISSISFNSSGSRMITGTHKGTLQVWELPSGKLLFDYEPTFPNRVTFAVFSPDEKFIYFDQSIALYKLRANLKGRPYLIDIRNRFITCGMISPDKKHLVFGGDHSVKFLDLEKDIIVRELGFCGSYVNELTFFGSDLVTWCQDGTINYWNTQKQGIVNLKPLATVDGGVEMTWSRVQFSETGKYLLTGNGYKNARVWDPQTRKLLFEIKGHNDTVRAFTFLNGEKSIVTGSFDGTVKLWEIKEESETFKIVEPKPRENFQPELKAQTGKDSISSRKIEVSRQIEIPNALLEAFVWDDNLDGDIISLNLNGKWILKNYPVTKEKRSVNLYLDPNTDNSLVLYAENTGTAPPNTARLSFFDGKKEQVIRLASDFKTCQSVVFRVKK